MTTEKVCSKGWGARCAVAKGNRCRCKCGGKNHNTIRLTQFEVVVDQRLALRALHRRAVTTEPVGYFPNRTGR